MTLQALLREVDPAWYHADGDAGTEQALDPGLVKRAQSSALGSRMLARWLVSGPAAALLAPRPNGGMGATVSRWPRPKLAGLLRDLGALAFAPAVRSEVRRDHVSLLKRVLGNGYTLALDNSIWDAAVDPDARRSLSTALTTAVTQAQADGSPAAVHALLDRQGRTELRAWALKRDAALADWVALQFPAQAVGQSVLPEKQVLFLQGHHEARTATT